MAKTYYDAKLDELLLLLREVPLFSNLFKPEALDYIQRRYIADRIRTVCDPAEVMIKPPTKEEEAKWWGT